MKLSDTDSKDMTLSIGYFKGDIVYNTEEKQMASVFRLDFEKALDFFKSTSV